MVTSALLLLRTLESGRLLVSATLQFAGGEKLTVGDAQAMGVADLPISAREKEVLALVAHGLSTREIAARLGLSSRTVDNHRTNIMRKLDVHNVAGLVRLAVSSGLVEA